MQNSRNRLARLRSSRRRCSLERLENRTYFFTYQVNGTSGNDSISLTISGNQIISVVNGVSDGASDALNDSIVIDGKGGSDTISINRNGDNTLTINAGDGNDTINLAADSHDLDNVTDVVTVNGEAGSDIVNLLDDSETISKQLNFSNGNRFTRLGMAAVTLETIENAVAEGDSASTSFAFFDVPNFNMTVHGNAGSDNGMHIEGTAAQSMVFSPSASPDAGSFSYGSRTISYTEVPDAFLTGFGTATYKTPLSDDRIDVMQVGTSQFVEGTSNGLSLTEMRFDNIGALAIDSASNDGAGSSDLIQVVGDITQAGVIRVNMGAGTNDLHVFGACTLDTGLGALGGTSVDVDVVSLSDVIFSGPQSLKTLSLSNSALRFSGSGTVLAVPDFSVSGATNTLRVDSGQTVSVSASLFAIGGVLTKTGLGTFNMDAPQDHSAGALLDVRGGTVNLKTDAGNAHNRNLVINSDNAVVNLNSSQHLAGVNASGTGGKINVGANGSRVLVTTAVSVANEGAQLNLNDNDMIVDYSTAAQANDVRALLHTGRANGAWNGIGIASLTANTNSLHNTALGLMEGTDFKGIYGVSAKFDNESFDNTSVLIKYTWYGDADFSGRVDGADYARIDAKFNQQGGGSIGGWINGDFDDNGKIDGSDYALIDGAFNSQSGVLRPSGSAGDARISHKTIGGLR